MVVIGIAGTNGAGKGVVAKFLVENKKFLHYSVREYLIERLREKNREITRENLRNVANKLRKEMGPSFIIEDIYRKAEKQQKNVVIESLRCPGEVEKLKEMGGVVFGVDADVEVRYERVQERAEGVIDDVDFEEFKLQEEIEFENEDMFSPNIKKCLEMSDYVFDNGGRLEELYGQVQNALDLVEVK